MNNLEHTGPWQPDATRSSQAGSSVDSETPRQIGRYRVERILGDGGFGRVFLARDEQLQRLVAVKVPHRNLFTLPDEVESYRAEARTAANLDHPHIVPVYDVGSTADYPCFIVAKYIEGGTLGQKLRERRFHPARGPGVFPEIAALVATIAEALHYAHGKGLVHRDVKPGNILLDATDQPFVTDFGLALREQDTQQGTQHAGTPAYMSPEQARGEGHRVDGRSDIFSLGVVLYELLAGRRAFQGESQAELLDQVTSVRVRPPRQVHEGIPKELERICLKAMAQRALERYSTASDMADDLRHFLATTSQTAAQPTSSRTALGGESTHRPWECSKTSDALAKIVPKGLRSFDAHDADFFLELLPGPRDRDGLPDNVRFWKARVEERDADKTFAVGLICGPSGCGKSSLVKAGLLPRLASDVAAVYVEATTEQTETRLLNGLRKQVPDLPVNLDLKGTITLLRRGKRAQSPDTGDDEVPTTPHGPPTRKVLLVIDQFEQWLHHHSGASSDPAKGLGDTELVQALRQCDGGKVQCLVMVRDDFWMAIIRFMRELEVRLLEGQNSAAVDLFDLDHATKVLAAFGRAFGKLPANLGRAEIEQKQFLAQAAGALAKDGKVICVRLALFAEMMKGKPWTPASLKAVGGAQGVGVTFLEETFSASTAPPEHRYHQQAARAVLRALLPESGTDIKGHMRPQDELLELSGYAGRRADFDDLIRILDVELRLITPSDPEGGDPQPRSANRSDSESKSPVHPGRAPRYYQLTHDYLVHSLRDWLTRKQKETVRGRAELLLADRAGLWITRPEYRLLPDLFQWLSIRLWTRQGEWNDAQRKMMRTANRFHLLRLAFALLLLLAATLVAVSLQRQWAEQRQVNRAAGLVQRLLDANVTQVKGIITDMQGYRFWVDPMLREEMDRAENGSRQKLYASLALLPADPRQEDYLFGRLLTAEPAEVLLIREALASRDGPLRGKLWAVVERSSKGRDEERRRAACALALYDPANPRWDKLSARIAEDLVSVDAVHLGIWAEGFRNIHTKLLKPLADIFRDRQSKRSAERTHATNLLADYAANEPAVLADLLMTSDDKQFMVLFPVFQRHGERGLGYLNQEMDKQSPPNAPGEVKETLARRQANAAAILLRMDRPARVWPILHHTPDPRRRSYLIHRFAPFGTDPRELLTQLDQEADITIRRALTLALGEFDEDSWPLSEREAALPGIQALYRTQDDPGLHAAAEWLLREWNHQQWLAEINTQWAQDAAARDLRLQRIVREAGGSSPGPSGETAAPPQWYVNGQGQTMVVLPGPVEFLMGSPTTEAGRGGDEVLHRQHVGRIFALAAKSVSKEQFLLFRPKFYHTELALYPESTGPVGGITWYEAAAYCNWLSAREGIPPQEWCYETDEKGQVTRTKDNYLRLTGYRLPTEAEWEFACRAGAITSRYYGESEELLEKYEWYLNNEGKRARELGRKKPNDWGFFDMLGNVGGWCQEPYRKYATSDGIGDDREDALTISNEQPRVVRGGSFHAEPFHLRCADRGGDVPNLRSFLKVGVRPARTLR